MSIGLKVLSHWTPSTTLAPQRSNMWKSIVKECPCIWTVTAVHSWWQRISSLLPTVTRSGAVSVGEIPKAITTRWCRKLYVLPPSTKMLTEKSPMNPCTGKVSGAEWPDRACKLSCAGGGSGSKSCVGDGEHGGANCGVSSSSFVTKRNNEDEHLWPRENFSS